MIFFFVHPFLFFLKYYRRLCCNGKLQCKSSQPEVLESVFIMNTWQPKGNPWSFFLCGLIRHFDPVFLGDLHSANNPQRKQRFNFPRQEK